MAKIKYNAKVWEATTTEWAADNTIYSPNDLLFDTDTGTYKRGNGVNKYSDLPTLGKVAAWSDITGKPAVIAAGANKEAARTAIDAAAINHDHIIAANSNVNLAAADNLQAFAEALSLRIKNLGET